MSLNEQFFDDEIHPIDMVQLLAENQDWEFERIADDQISMAVEGQWRTYSITLAWSDYDETLRMVCTFEMEPPEQKIPALYHALNVVNDQCWSGSFTYWAAQQLMVYRYGMVVTDGHILGQDQIDSLIGSAVSNAERYYPAFQLVVWGGRTPEDALQIAIAETYGRA